MPPTKKKSTQKKRTNGKRSNWKNLRRDSRGRWISSKATKTTSIKAKKHLKKVIKKKTSEAKEAKEQKKVTKILGQIEQTFAVDCPRCGGDLKHHRIRCGPERLISVKKCNICNYWIPLSDK